MAHATNRTEMLAKALKRARPDFSLHNSRVFARAVIDAPAEVFGQKPLTFLPLDQSSSYRWRAAAEAAAGDPDQTYNAASGSEPGRFAASGRYLTERYGAGKVSAESTSQARSTITDLGDIRPGDVIVAHTGVESAVAMGNGRGYGRDGSQFALAQDAIVARRYDVREVDPLAEIADPDLAWVSTLAQLTALCGWGVDSPEALLLDQVLRPEYRQQRDITTLAALVDHLRNSGDEYARVVHDRIRFRITDPSPLVDRSAEAPNQISVSGQRVDFPDAESARLAAEIANIGTEPVPDDVVFRRRGREVPGEDARPGDMIHAGESNRMIGVVVAVHPDGSKDMVAGPQSLPIMLALTEETPPAESAGIPLSPEDQRRVPMSPTEARPGDILVAGGTVYTVLDADKVLDPETGEAIPFDRTPAMTGPDDGFFRPAASGAEGGEWARFVENLPAGYTPVISTGLQPLDPLKLIRPTFNLPPSATRPTVAVRERADAVKLWKDTRFHVGVGAEGPVTWSPAEAGSMLVTGRTGSGSSVFVQGMVTDARISGWDIIWLDRHIDADTYAATIANAHTLSARRTADQAPVLVVLDEFQAFSRTFAVAHDKAKVAELSNQMLDMLELAGTSHVHLLLVTHDLHAQTIPSTWLPHFGAAVAMGQPSDMTLRKLAGDVKVPSEAFPKGVPGRAVFFDRTPPGTNQVVQTYLPTQAKDSLAFIFGDEINTMDPELARKLAERPGRPLTPHEYIAGINGGLKLLDTVNQMRTEAPLLGQALNSILGRPANASTVDQSKPNHFYFDSLGDPLTCTEDHNHPSGPDDEPAHNVKIRALHQLASLPEQSDRGDISPNGAWRERSFPIGVNHLGRTVCFSPAQDGPLLVLGAARGALVRGLTRTAREDSWEVELIERQKTARYVHGELAQVVAEIDHLWISKMSRGVPKLVILDANLFTDWSEEWRARISDQITRLIEAGPAKAVHTVLVCDERQKQFILPLAKRGGAVIFDGPPTAEDAAVLLGQDAFIAAGSDEPAWKGSGKMLLIRATEGNGARPAPEPFRAFVDAPEPQESWD